MKKYIPVIFNNFYFCIFYLGLSLTFITPLNSLPGVNLLPKIGIAWGGLIALYNVYLSMKSKPNIFEIFIYLFLLSSISLILIKYPSSENIKIWIVNLILLLSIFHIGRDKSKEKLYKEMSIFSNIFIVITLLSSIFSIALRIPDTSILINDVTYNAYTSFFANQNTYGIASAISFVLSILMFVQFKKKKELRYFYLANSLLQLVSIYISSCRSALLILLVIPYIFLFINLKNNKLRSCLVIFPILVILGVYIYEKDFILNFTSGRSELWHNAYIVFKNNIMSGVGNSNLVQAIIDARPTTYLPGLTTGGVHNIYLQMLAVQGIIASLLFFALLIISVVALLKYVVYEKNKNKQNYIGILICLVIGLLATNILESNIIYVVSFISITLWYYLGNALTLMKKD